MKKIYESPVMEITKIAVPEVVMLSVVITNGNTTNANNLDNISGIDFGNLFG